MAKKRRRPDISPLDAAKMSIMVKGARLLRVRADGRQWSQEDMAEALSAHLGRYVGRHEAQWLESSSIRPYNKPRHRRLWGAACVVLDLDRGEVDRLAGGCGE